MTSTELIKHESPQELPSNRKFGTLFFLVFAIIGFWPVLFGNSQPRIWSLAVAATFLTFTVVAPDFLEPLNKIWMQFAEVLHNVASPVVLGVVYFGVITPIAVLMRLRGKDILQLRKHNDIPSYWIHRQPPGPKPDTLIRQF